MANGHYDVPVAFTVTHTNVCSSGLQELIVTALTVPLLQDTPSMASYMDRESKQSRSSAHLRGVSGVGAPGQLGDAEAEHGDDVDVDAPIPEISDCPVHSIRMLRGYIWMHLQSKFWSIQQTGPCIEARCSLKCYNCCSMTPLTFILSAQSTQDIYCECSITNSQVSSRIWC